MLNHAAPPTLSSLSRRPDELPPKTTVGPDANGNIVSTEYYIDDDGKKVKVRITTPTRVPVDNPLGMASLTATAARLVTAVSRSWSARSGSRRSSRL